MGEKTGASLAGGEGGVSELVLSLKHRWGAFYPEDFPLTHFKKRDGFFCSS